MLEVIVMENDMEQNLTILTERQRQVYLLRAQKLTFAEIGTRLGVSAAAGGSAPRAASPRLRTQAILLETPPAEEKSQPVAFPLNRSELEAVVSALLLLQRDMRRRAGTGMRLRDPLPPKAARVADLLHRAQTALAQADAPRPARKDME